MQRTVPQVAFELPPSVGAPLQARRRCEQLCRDWDLESLRSDCSLLVSELVTNAVLHGAGPILLEIDRDDRGLRVAVANESAVGSASPSPRDASTVDQGGRGLAIVGAVAARWGTHRDEVGTRVWFELRA